MIEVQSFKDIGSILIETDLLYKNWHKYPVTQRSIPLHGTFYHILLKFYDRHPIYHSCRMLRHNTDIKVLIEPKECL